MPARGHCHGWQVYVSGSASKDGERIDAFVVFDPQANTWTELASMGTARRSHTSAVIGGKLYVFGGRSLDGHTTLSTSVEAYDPVSFTWAQASDLTCDRAAFVAVAI